MSDYGHALEFGYFLVPDASDPKGVLETARVVDGLGQSLGSDAALSYARARASALGLEREFLRSRDLHVHIPAGATPKDGPSAGIAIACAIVSALSGIPLRGDVAMTGEITLRGRVLPIGGVKEKVLGAHRAGISTIILPKDNEADMEDIPEDVRKQLTFHCVSTLDEVFEIALVPANEPVSTQPTLMEEMEDKATLVA